MPESISPRRDLLNAGALLETGLRALALDAALAAPLLVYLDELAKWNGAYNLTAIRDPRAMVTRHLLDSLAVLPALDRLAGGRAVRLIDIGSGAGLPGIPLALARHDWQVALLDANGKKARFLRHARRALKLANVEVFEQRAEAHEAAVGYDVVISRAFASLDAFVAATRAALAVDGKWLAMKGKLAASEQDDLPAGIRIHEVIRLVVPGLDEQRHLIVAAPAPTSDPPP